jgi:phytanoyl-CoA hydroxylase
MLTPSQIDFYQENGFLHIPQVFDATEINELSDEMDRLVEEWAFTSPGWSGPWRQAYMDPETEKQSKLTAMHDLHFYSAAWMRAVTHPRLVDAMSDLLGPNVELHHSTMHIKPPQTGHPFPMHQDNPFYHHSNGQYIDVLVHLDDTSHANGEIRFLAGSHKAGPLPHIIHTAAGPCTPHLPFAGQARRCGDLQSLYDPRLVYQHDQAAATAGAHRLSRPAKSSDPRAERWSTWVDGEGISHAARGAAVVWAGVT